MDFNFVDYKSDFSYVVLLPKIAFRYCNNFDGRIYTSINLDAEFDGNVVAKLIEKLNPFVITKRNAVILNLLVIKFSSNLL